jgi:endonuclease III
MKNATKHADELKSLHKRLMKDHKSEPRQPVEALKALVRAAMSYDVPDARADEAMKHLEKEFVDLNELRVATELEVQEMLGQRYPAIEKRVAMITAALNRIFEKEHTLSLDRLKTLNKREARQFLRDLPDMHPFVEAYVMLYAFDGHAIPLDEEMLAALRDLHIADAETPLVEAQKFVEHNIKAEDCHDFFIAFRRHLSDKGKKKK